MNTAHDVFSETNPAFCAYALARFANAYTSSREDGPELLLAYLSLPIAMSGDVQTSFEGTDRRTGLGEWLERSPQLSIDLAHRINFSIGIVAEGIRFGCFCRLLLIEGIQFQPGELRIRPSVTRNFSGGTKEILSRAERLGHWFAKAGSTKAVFSMMGLTV